MSDSTVIGYYSLKPPMGCYCEGEALVVAGSHAAIKRMLAIAGVAHGSYKIMKARFGDVLAGLGRGGAYAFDAESYRKFSALARGQGIPCSEFDFTPSRPEEIKLVTITL